MSENEDKGLAIFAGELYPYQRDWLVLERFFTADQMREIYEKRFHIVLFNIGTFNYDLKDHLIRIGCRVSHDPSEFMAYVTQKTGKELNRTRWPEEAALASKEPEVFVPPGLPSERYKNIKQFIMAHICEVRESFPYDDLIRAVLLDLPQKYAVRKDGSFITFEYIAPTHRGEVYQYIGSISEEVIIKKEGYV